MRALMVLLLLLFGGLLAYVVSERSKYDRLTDTRDLRQRATKMGEGYVAGHKDAALVIDRTWVGNNTSHQVLEPRSAMAYWQGGKLFLHGGTQSTVQTVPNIARWVGIKPEEVVLISEYTGGGFGSRIPGYIAMAIPALLSKKANAPVMMRISRDDESHIGRARTNMSGRVKVGFAKDGRITALDLFIVQDSGAYGPMGDFRSGANAASLIYQPKAMRVRAVNVLTNTPPRTQQRSPTTPRMNTLPAVAP